MRLQFDYKSKYRFNFEAISFTFIYGHALHHFKRLHFDCCPLTWIEAKRCVTVLATTTEKKNQLRNLFLKKDGKLYLSQPNFFFVFLVCIYNTKQTTALAYKHTFRWRTFFRTMHIVFVDVVVVVVVFNSIRKVILCKVYKNMQSICYEFQMKATLNNAFVALNVQITLFVCSSRIAF